MALTNLPLAAILRDSGVDASSLCRTAVKEVSALLRSPKDEGHFPHDVVLESMETLFFLLPQVDPKDWTEISEMVIRDLCDPCLMTLTTTTTAASSVIELPAHIISAAGNMISMILKNRHSPRSAIVEMFTDLLAQCHHRLCSSSDPTTPTTATIGHHHEVVLPLLSYVLRRALPDEIEHDGDISMSPLFESLLELLQHADLQTSYLVASSLLPLMITEVHLEQRVSSIWHFIVQVYHHKLHVHSLSSSDLLLTLLCSFSDVFISFNRSSPFSGLFPECLSERRGAPVCDLRKEGVFWNVVQEGLTSSDPLARKRCMYLLHSVLASVSTRKEGAGKSQAEDEVMAKVGGPSCGVGVASSDGAVVSEGWMFWWSTESEEKLAQVWSDLVLVLETMEEKQVGVVMSRWVCQ